MIVILFQFYYLMALHHDTAGQEMKSRLMQHVWISGLGVHTFMSWDAKLFHCEFPFAYVAECQ